MKPHFTCGIGKRFAQGSSLQHHLHTHKTPAPVLHKCRTRVDCMRRLSSQETTNSCKPLDESEGPSSANMEIAQDQSHAMPRRDKPQS